MTEEFRAEEERHLKEELYQTLIERWNEFIKNDGVNHQFIAIIKSGSLKRKKGFYGNAERKSG